MRGVKPPPWEVKARTFGKQDRIKGTIHKEEGAILLFHKLYHTLRLCWNNTKQVVLSLRELSSVGKTIYNICKVRGSNSGHHKQKQGST